MGKGSEVSRESYIQEWKEEFRNKNCREYLKKSDWQYLGIVLSQPHSFSYEMYICTKSWLFTPDPYPRLSDVKLQAFAEVWGGCGRDLITEVSIIGT